MSFEDKKILVVDDMSGIRVWFKKTLQKNGFHNIDEAADGNIAIDMISRTKYDLLFLDVVMPNKGGEAVVKYIKETAIHSHLKIVIVSAESDRAEVLKLVKMGINGYVIKPATEAGIIKKIQEVFTAPTT